MPTDKKITGLPAATLPLSGNEKAEIVQGGVNKQVDTSEFVSGYQKLSYSETTITDAATMDIAAIKNALTTSSATRTFTISYTGDYILMKVILNAASSTFTFPATALCVSEGVASGDNTCGLSGTSGDLYIIAIEKVGSLYFVACKNFGQ